MEIIETFSADKYEYSKYVSGVGTQMDHIVTEYNRTGILVLLSEN